MQGAEKSNARVWSAVISAAGLIIATLITTYVMMPGDQNPRKVLVDTEQPPKTEPQPTDSIHDGSHEEADSTEDSGEEPIETEEEFRFKALYWKPMELYEKAETERRLLIFYAPRAGMNILIEANIELEVRHGGGWPGQCAVRLSCADCAPKDSRSREFTWPPELEEGNYTGSVVVRYPLTTKRSGEHSVLLLGGRGQYPVSVTKVDVFATDNVAANK